MVAGVVGVLGDGMRWLEMAVVFFLGMEGAKLAAIRRRRSGLGFRAGVPVCCKKGGKKNKGKRG